MIPTDLWKGNILYQSKKLISIYTTELKSLKMHDYAVAYSGKGSGAIGGECSDDTKIHFSERFLASSARLQYLIFDPEEDFLKISIDLKSTFGSGHISLLDIPCGTGAGVLSLLCNLAELRQSSKLPKLPLFINIMAGDYSQTALNIYTNLLNDIKSELEKELIFINYQTFLWNATDMKSTKLLIKNWLKDEEKYEEFYILMSAFSGDGVKLYKSFEESFKFIQNYVCDMHVTTILIEPNSNDAKRYIKMISTTFKVFMNWLIGEEVSTGKKRFKWHNAINNNIAQSDILVKQYSRE